MTPRAATASISSRIPSMPRSNSKRPKNRSIVASVLWEAEPSSRILYGLARLPFPCPVFVSLHMVDSDALANAG